MIRLFFGFSLLLTTFAHVVSAQGILPTTHYKYQVTLQVTEQIARTFGDRRSAPRLEMPVRSKSGRIAEMILVGEPVLYFDEKLYDICQSFGADSTTALALVLAHELTHYYERHNEWMGFAQLAKKLPPPIKAEEKKRLELQADQRGMFQAFVAGYQPFSIVKPLYEKIYTDYKLELNIPGYFSRDERIKLAQEQSVVARNAGVVFETGNFLFLNGQYALAERCYRYISNLLPIQEVIHNQGIAWLQQAYQMTSLSTMPFKLPIELAATNRMLSDLRSGEEEKRQKMLNEASRIFTNLIEQDPTYEAGYLGLCSTYLLQNQNGAAEDLLKKWETNGGKLSPNGQLLKAITFAQNKNERGVKRQIGLLNNVYEQQYNVSLLKKYFSWFNQREELNVDSLQVFQKKNAAHKENSKPIENQIFNLKFPLVAASLPNQFNLPGQDFIRTSYALTDGLLSFNVKLADKQFDVIHATACTAQWQTKQQLKKGETEARLLELYGVPSQKIPAGNDVFWYGYENARCWFVVNNGRVEEWTIFEQKSQ